MPDNELLPFSGFPKSGIKFLEKLPNHDKAWFEERRKQYEQTLLSPTKSLVQEIGERIRKTISPSITAKPAVNGSISPIFRDLRFSKDKTVFKDHLLLNFWDGKNKKLAPTLRIRISPSSIGFATGIMFPNGPELQQWRDAVVNEPIGEDLNNELSKLLTFPDSSLSEPELKRVPAPFAADHSMATLLCRKTLQARWLVKTPPCILDETFADYCVAELIKAKPVHLWLVKHLQ